MLVQATVAALPGSASASLPGARKMLTRAPYLTDLTSTSVRINFATRLQRRGLIRFGRAGHRLTRVTIDRHRGTPITVKGIREFQSSVLISGLAPNTAYRYRVGTADGKRIDLLGSNPSPRFTTLLGARRARQFTFDVMGDWGDTTNSGVNDGRLNKNQARIDALIASSGARFMISAGDTAYPGGTQTDYGDLEQTGVNVSAVFGPRYWARPGERIPYYAVSGNHGRNGTYLFEWPEASTVRRSHGAYAMRFYRGIDGIKPNRYPTSYYAFSTGGVRFYLLDASWGDNNVGHATGGGCRHCAIYQVDHDAHWRAHSAELRWLKRDLATHRGVMKIAVWHFPLYSDDSSQPGDAYLAGPGHLEGLLHRNGVKLVFNGHAHIYQRNVARPGGIISYVTGGGGGRVQPVGARGCASTDAYSVGWSYRRARGSACGPGAAAPASDSQVYNFLRVTVHGRTVTVRPINALGQSFDVQTYHF